MFEFMKFMKKRFVYNVLFIIFVCMLCEAALYHFASKALTGSVESSLKEIAVQGAKIVESNVTSKLHLLEMMASLPVVRSADIPKAEKLHALEMNFERQDIRRISIADTNGESLTTEGVQLNVAGREYFQKALAGQSNVSDPVISRVDGDLVLAFAVPIYQEGKIVGVMYATQDMKELLDIVGNMRLGGDGSAFLLNDQGTIIAHSDRQFTGSFYNILEEAEADSSLKEYAGLARRMLERESGVTEYEIDGIRKYAGYAPVTGTDWIIAIEAPKRSLFREVNETLGLIMLLAVILLAVFAGFRANTYLLKRKLEREQSALKAVVDIASIIALEIDASGRIIAMNKYAEEKTGYTRHVALDKMTLLELTADDDAEKVEKMLSIIQSEGAVNSYDLPLCCKNGKQAYILWNIERLNGNNGDHIEMIGIDITERVEYEIKLQENHEELRALYEELTASEEELKEKYQELSLQQEKLNRLAYNDTLTGLPNRVQLENTLNQIIEMHDSVTALIFIDLDNFKIINDTFGHPVGDAVLVDVGERLVEVVKNKEMVFRLGGDEFAILVREQSIIDRLGQYVESILKGLNIRFSSQGVDVPVTASIGVVLYPEHGSSFQELFKNADTAMYKAKSLGRNQSFVFNQQLNTELIGKIKMESCLRKALDNNELFLQYQPLYCLKRRRTCGLEALVRWNSPEYGLVSPLKFIPIAEETGLIVQIGKWVLKSACVFAERLHRAGFDRMMIAVNISVRQLVQEDFVQEVLRIIEETRIEAKYLELEITESVLMDNIESNLKKIQALRQYGINVALDDFGTGYSSLTYLRKLPISTLKVEKAFIDDIAKEETNRDIAKSIIMLAHTLGLKVVAEGVEVKEQLNCLTGFGCDWIQGYFISKPLAEGDIIDFLKTEIKLD